MHITRVPPLASPAWTPATPLANAAPARPGALWPAWLKGVLARAAERRELLVLEDRELRDIGLTRAEAWNLARQAVWRR